MAFKLSFPLHNLGPFLTRNGIVNIDIYAQTGIPTDELSKLRNGFIKGIDAKKLFLIIKSSALKTGPALVQIYPTVGLLSTDQETEKRRIEDIDAFFDSIEQNTLNKISDKTGISVTRLTNIRKSKVNPLAHELYLIELATKVKPGTLFDILYRDLELNTSEEETRLRLLEKNKSSKKH